MAGKQQWIDEVTLENVRIVFRNFSGRKGQYNPEGNRNFGALLTEEQAESMATIGWNVKELRAREDDPDSKPQPWIPVALGFGGAGRPPLVVMLTSRGRTTLGEDDVASLDYVNIRNVDLILRPFKWDKNGNTGIKAYVKSIYVTINEDELELKYADVPDVDSNANTREWTPLTEDEADQL